MMRQFQIGPIQADALAIYAFDSAHDDDEDRPPFTWDFVSHTLGIDDADLEAWADYVTQAANSAGDDRGMAAYHRALSALSIRLRHAARRR